MRRLLAICVLLAAGCVTQNTLLLDLAREQHDSLHYARRRGLTAPVTSDDLVWAAQVDRDEIDYARVTSGS